MSRPEHCVTSNNTNLTELQKRLHLAIRTVNGPRARLLLRELRSLDPAWNGKLKMNDYCRENGLPLLPAGPHPDDADAKAPPSPRIPELPKRLPKIVPTEDHPPGNPPEEIRAGGS